MKAVEETRTEIKDIEAELGDFAEPDCMTRDEEREQSELLRELRINEYDKLWHSQYASAIVTLQLTSNRDRKRLKELEFRYEDQCQTGCL